MMLKCNQNGEFTILVVADPQCENTEQWEEARDELALLVKKSNPDLVVINGDMESHNNIPVEAWSCLIEPLTKQMIPWVTTNGNHDPFRADIDRMYQSFSACQNQLVDAEDVDFEPSRPLNYQLPIYGKDGKHIVLAVYGMDTGDYINGGWDGVTKKQVSWYRKKASALREVVGKTVPAVLCCHIAFSEVKKMDILGGVENEVGAVTAAQNDHGLFAAVKEMGDVKLAVFGHSHQINHIGVYDGIFLSYAGKLSSGSYHDTLCRGGRVIRFQQASARLETAWLSSIPSSQDQPTVTLYED